MKNNIRVQAFDPVSINNFKNILSHPNLSFGVDMYDVLENVDALVLCTEWNEFRSPDFNKLKLLMKEKVIFDGKNIYDSQNLSSFGFEHFQVGVKS